jgi:hypothetical protein
MSTELPRLEGLETYTKPINHTRVDDRIITVVKLKAEGSLEVGFLWWSQRVVEKLGVNDVLGEFLALETFRSAGNLLRVGFEPSFGWGNRRHGLEAIGPIIGLSGCDAMPSLTVSVVAVVGQCTI